MIYAIAAVLVVEIVAVILTPIHVGIRARRGVASSMSLTTVS